MRYFSLIICALMMQGCTKPTLYSTGTITPHRAQVIENQYYHKFHVHELGALDTYTIAEHYQKYGEGLISIYAFYDPNKKNKRKLNDALQDAYDGLAINGAGYAQADMFAVPGHDHLVISYTYLSAEGPRDCEPMSGYHNTDIGNNKDYRMGCTVETLIARQIARPSDLLGREVDYSLSEGRSASNIINAQRSGAMNEPLAGYQASGE